jgi:Tfp pilus assembly protein PilF
MIAFLLAAASPPSPADAHYQSCVQMIQTDAAKALESAEQWRDEGGGVPARTCVGLALVAQERWQAAEVAFEQAARESELRSDGHAASLWAQAGNAALAADDPSGARNDLDRALNYKDLAPDFRSGALIDRARAAVALSDLKAARADLDTAVKLTPLDPDAWLFSATLARREGDLKRAGHEISQAARLAPQDEAIQKEQQLIVAQRPAPSPNAR